MILVTRLSIVIGPKLSLWQLENLQKLWRPECRCQCQKRQMTPVTKSKEGNAPKHPRGLTAPTLRRRSEAHQAATSPPTPLSSSENPMNIQRNRENQHRRLFWIRHVCTSSQTPPISTECSSATLMGPDWHNDRNSWWACDLFLCFVARNVHSVRDVCWFAWAVAVFLFFQRFKLSLKQHASVI